MGLDESQYPFYQIGEAGLQANKYLIAINTRTSSLEIYRFIGSPKQYIQSNVSVFLSDIGLENVDYRLLDNVSIAGELMVLKLPEGEEQSIKVLKVGEKEIQTVFDMSGEEIKVSSDLRIIEVKNSVGEEFSIPYIYQYDGESYIKQQQEIEEISLSDMSLGDKIGKMVKFECYLPEMSQNELVTVYHCIDNTYFFNQGADLKLAEGMSLMEGRYVITGKITEMTVHYDEGLQMEVIRPVIDVLQVEQR